MGLYKCISNVWRKKQFDPTKLFKGWEYTSKRSLSSVTRSLQITEGRCVRSQATQDVLGGHGISFFQRRQSYQELAAGSLPPYQLSTYAAHYVNCFARTMSSKASNKPSGEGTESKKDISTVEDPFDAPTYHIPEKPVTFAEGSMYSVVILAGLGIAALAGFAVFKELIFEPKEYKIFGKALKRIQDDSQVRVRIGSPITGYGQESRNRAARQRIPNRIWTDEDGVEHVEVNFYIRGPHGNGKVYSEMFKDNVDKEWKFTYLIVEIRAPSPSQLILESYMPAYNADKQSN